MSHYFGLYISLVLDLLHIYWETRDGVYPGILDISGCHHRVTDLGVSYLSQSSCLHTVSLSYLPKVSDSSLKLLAHSGNLKCLKLQADTGITDQGCSVLHEDIVNLPIGVSVSLLDLSRSHLRSDREILLLVGFACDPVVDFEEDVWDDYDDDNGDDYLDTDDPLAAERWKLS